MGAGNSGDSNNSRKKERDHEMELHSDHESIRDKFADQDIIIQNDPYQSVISFGLQKDLELYATYCPMALNGKVAYWMEESKEGCNSYLGEKMMKCGEVKEEL
jgi:hypothetical protein